MTTEVDHCLRIVIVEKAITKCRTFKGDIFVNFHLTHAMGAVHYTMMTMDTASIVSDGFSTWLTFSRQPRLLTCFKRLSCCIWNIVGSKKSLGL